MRTRSILALALAALVAGYVAVGLAGAASTTARTLHPSSQGTCSEATIENPKDGDTLAGQVAVFGSARLDNFNFFKLEVAPKNAPGTWAAVSNVINTPVLRGLL